MPLKIKHNQKLADQGVFVVGITLDNHQVMFGKKLKVFKANGINPDFELTVDQHPVDNFNDSIIKEDGIYFAEYYNQDDLIDKKYYLKNGNGLEIISKEVAISFFI